MPEVAAAEDVDAEEFAARVERALGGDETDLRAVTAVDGGPVAGETLLADNPDEQRARLETLRDLISSEVGFELDAAEIREQAEEIVTNPPYSAEVANDGGLFARVFDFLSRLFGNEAAQGLALLIVALAALAVAIPVFNRIASRRQRREADPIATEASRVDYTTAAEKATERGDFAEAVRMLFLDGVEHLEASRAVPDAGTTSTAAVRRLSGNESFLDRFDEIAYGGSPAGEADVKEAHSGWQRLKRRFT